MTDEQIEEAARQLCYARGVNPDDRYRSSTECTRLEWSRAKDDIRDYLLIKRVIAGVTIGRDGQGHEIRPDTSTKQ